MPPDKRSVELTAAPNKSTRARVYRCCLCQKKFPSNNGWCPACGGQRALYLLEDGETLEALPDLIRADAFTMPSRKMFPAGDWAPCYPKGIPGGTIILMRGAPGAGKTRLALRLGTQMGLCGYISLELTAEDCVETAEVCGADCSRLVIADQFDEHRTLEQLGKEGCSVLGLDSIQKLGFKPQRYYDDIQRFARGGNGGRVVLVITQSNAKGGTRGGLSLEFDLAESVCMVRDAKDGLCEVTMEKNRRGPCAVFLTPKVAGVQAGKVRRIKGG